VQLIQHRVLGIAFGSFQEAPITFGPTYRSVARMCTAPIYAPVLWAPIGSTSARTHTIQGLRSAFLLYFLCLPEKMLTSP